MNLSFRRLEMDDLLETVDGGVIKAADQHTMHQARDIVAQAREEAARLLEDADARATESLQQREAEREQRMWRSAADYGSAVEGEWARSVAELETRVTQLVGQAIRRLAEEVPSDERLRACVRQLMAQSGVPDGGSLWVSEADHAQVAALPGLPWPVQRSPSVAPGAVRLVSTHGRWECDIQGAIERLIQALGPTDASPKETRDGPTSTPEPEHGLFRDGK